jgi:hypothetical protein
MRNKFYFSIFMCFFAWMMFNGVTSSAGKSGKSGAPGESTCIQCHSSNSLNDPTGSIAVSVAGVTNGQYTAGQTYQVSVTIAKSGQSLFGFSAVALDDAGQNTGALVAGTDSHTETSAASGTNRNYVTHNSNGGLSSNQKTFTFSWTAPSSGNVNFYFSGIAANNNGGTSGDFVYTSNLTLAPATMGGGVVVINEVDADQAGPDAQEFVELYGTPNMSLNGYTIVFFNGNNSLAYSAFDLDGFSLDANGFFVIGNPTVPNVDLTFDPGASGLLQNGADAVALYLADATAWPVDAPPTTTGLVDAVVYGTLDPDATGLLTVLTPGQLQVNETAGNIPECLARVPDGGTPLVVTSYVQQLPTPGASNSTTVVSGCMNTNACNYNSAATVDDNSCLYTGATCDDGNPNSTGDAIDASCQCVGQVTQVSVTFQVDMSTSTIAPSGVFLQGDFQNWQANPDIPMTDADADGVYAVTIVLPANAPIQYKFLNGTGGWEVTPALAACGTPDLVNVDGYNRADTTAAVDLVLPVVCFGSCNACAVSSTGCMVPNACNYDPTATINDIASCVFATTWYLDADADGYYASSTSACTNPGSGYTATQGINGDCNDAVAGINAGATEICGNSIDEDCSGADLSCSTEGCMVPVACNYDAAATIDNGSCTYASLTYFIDADADGVGAGNAVLFCSNPGAGYSLLETDCDDNNAAISPNAIEICNGLDENCNGESDEFVTTTYYIDADADGFGDLNNAVQECALPVGYVSNFDDCDDNAVTYLDADNDGEGSVTADACGVANNLDCNDNAAAINTSAEDFCENGIDENCNGTDEICTGIPGCTDMMACNYDATATQNNGSCTYATMWYLDLDMDGYASEVLSACTSPGVDYTSTVLVLNDCDDTDLTINPGATDVCENGIDEDCSGADAVCSLEGCTDATACNYNASATVDNGSCSYAIMWYLDADADGYYVSSQSSCTNPGMGYSDVMGVDGDCDDAVASINAAAVEICGDGIDQNCDGLDDACAILGCIDVTACNFEPLATEDDGSCFFSTDWYLDLDLDGYASEMLNACTSPGVDYTSTVLVLNDCDDTDATINPGATDVCENGIDEDCSGADASCTIEGCTDATACNYDAAATVDNGSCTYSSTWYLDADADGYYTITIQSCVSPGVTFNNIGGTQGDCDDNLANVNAGAPEICGNDVDENCDGTLEQCQPGCPNPIIITVDSIANLECFGIPTGYIGVSVSGGSGLYNAQWNTNPIQTTPYASNLPAGFHSISIIDTEGCGDTLTVEITQPAGSFPVVSGNNDTAPAENAQYTVNTYPGATYTWSVTGGVIISGQGTESINVLWNDVAFGNVTVTQNSDDCELSDGITIFVNGVGVDETLATTMSIFPNPARGVVTLLSNQSELKWEIVEMSGRIVLAGNSYQTSTVIDISNCAPGLYLVRTNEGTAKLIIE